MGIELVHMGRGVLISQYTMKFNRDFVINQTLGTTQGVDK